ncbi:MAG: ImmA/IrrE family metallo-endopeptidase [Fibrobacter sp.]|nr:ImmA/IrrE family metallo-endopeptidase [Fibrobacter sp.]
MNKTTYGSNEDVDKLNHLVKLFDEIRTYQNPENFKNLLEFLKKFRTIAPFNAFLLHTQRPGSAFVATVHDWNDKFNRSVKDGANPLVILKPFAPVQFVYELNDTTGADFPKELLEPFDTKGELPSYIINRFIANLNKYGIEYEEVQQGTMRAGSINLKDKAKIVSYSKKHNRILYYSLIVNNKLKLEDKFSTIAHELGHLFCGHLGTLSQKLWPDRNNLTTEIREFEAECVSYIVCTRQGLQPSSAEYLFNYLKEVKTLIPVSLELILKATGIVENIIHGSFSTPKEFLEKI